MDVLNTAFYLFTPLDLAGSRAPLRRDLKAFCSGLELKGTILLSPEGINGFLAGAPDCVRRFKAHLAVYPEFKNISYKDSVSAQIPFKRLKVKLKREIIPLGLPEIQPAELTGKRLSAQELKSWYDERKPFVLLDTRNTYETERGMFEESIHLSLDHFRNFPEKFKDYWGAHATDLPIVMVCTGGIRCEKATAVALQEGVKEVYQLEGGILKYFEECGDAHYQGECFVFDERAGLRGDLSPTVANP